MISRLRRLMVSLRRLPTDQPDRDTIKEMLVIIGALPVDGAVVSCELLFRVLRALTDPMASDDDRAAVAGEVSDAIGKNNAW